MSFDKIDDFIEVLEYAAGRSCTGSVPRASGLIHVENQAFWCTCINFLLLRFEEFEFQQLIDCISILYKAGFMQGLSLYDEYLPEDLADKVRFQSKRRRLMRSLLLRQYTEEQIELHAEDVVYKPVLSHQDILDKVNLLQVCRHGAKVL